MPSNSKDVFQAGTPDELEAGTSTVPDSSARIERLTVNLMGAEQALNAYFSQLGLNPAEAVMNPDAVTVAKVYEGRVHYHKGGRSVEVTGQPFVELGAWTGEGDELPWQNFMSTYHAAVALGYGRQTFWLPTGEGNTGEHKLLITNYFDSHGVVRPLSQEDAMKKALAVNKLLVQMVLIRSEADGKPIHPKE